MTLANFTAISGMILDVLGAFILARSFILKRPTDVFRELKSFGRWDLYISCGARDLLLSWLVQSFEARIGALIIGIGFGLQATSQVLPPSTLPYAGYGLILVAVAAFYSFFKLQRWFVRRAARHAHCFYDELEAEATSEDWKKTIPMRREELRQIKKQPGKWLDHTLELSEGIDHTLTSNE